MKYVYDYPRPAVATDILIYRRFADDQPLQILLIERRDEPFAHRWALPGGFLDENETLEQAARRELREETGLDFAASELTQLKAYSQVDRDPRTRVISVVFVVKWRLNQRIQAGDDARDVRWSAVDQLPELAFDHDQIVRDGLQFIHQQALPP